MQREKVGEVAGVPLDARLGATLAEEEAFGNADNFLRYFNQVIPW